MIQSLPMTGYILHLHLTLLQLILFTGTSDFLYLVNLYIGAYYQADNHSCKFQPSETDVNIIIA